MDLQVVIVTIRDDKDYIRPTIAGRGGPGLGFLVQVPCHSIPRVLG